jgi:predicted amidohydrolase YtcJ
VESGGDSDLHRSAGIPFVLAAGVSLDVDLASDYGHCLGAGRAHWHQLRSESGKVTTLRGEGEVAEALAVRGERFVAVGDEAQVMRLAGQSTRVVDAGGRRVIPGPNDSHMHTIRGGLQYNLEFRWDGVRSLQRGLEMIRQQAKRTPEGQWVRVMPHTSSRRSGCRRCRS